MQRPPGPFVPPALPALSSTLPALAVAYEDLAAAGRHWGQAEEEAAAVVRDLAAATTDGLPPAVVAAADGFLAAWLARVARSRALAAGLERAVGLAGADLLGADGGAADLLAALGRPAPAAVPAVPAR